MQCNVMRSRPISTATAIMVFPSGGTISRKHKHPGKASVKTLGQPLPNPGKANFPTPIFQQPSRCKALLGVHHAFAPPLPAAAVDANDTCNTWGYLVALLGIHGGAAGDACLRCTICCGTNHCCLQELYSSPQRTHVPSHAPLHCSPQNDAGKSLCIKLKGEGGNTSSGTGLPQLPCCPTGSFPGSSP